MNKDNQNNEELLLRIKELEDKVSGLTMENQMLQISINESESLHKSVVENSLDGTLIFDKDFDIIYANDEVFNISSYNESELLDFRLEDLVAPETLENVKNILNDVLNKVIDSKKFEFDLINRYGEIRNIFASCSFTNDFQGNKALVLQILDITDIKSAERRMIEINHELEQRVNERTSQLQETMDDLKVEIAVRKKAELELQLAKEEVDNALEKEKELNTLKTRFISMISHEYRTPLTVILTSTYLVEQYYQGEHQEQFNKFLGKIRNSVDTMTQLLEDVLTIGKAESVKSKIIPKKINIIDYIREIIEECKVVDKDKHNFILNYELSSPEIISDEKSLRHIFQNIISNAAKYSPGADEVTIDIKENSRNLVVYVTDKGIGIPNDDIANLFETFHRASNVGSISGTGLGLSIVKRCLDSLYGEIGVQSELGKGTKFILELPKDIQLFMK